MDLNKVTQDAMGLSVRERGILAAQLLASIDAAETGDLKTAWLDTAEKRLREIDEGLVQPISEEEVRQRIRKRLQ